MEHMISKKLVDNAIDLAHPQILAIMENPAFIWGPRYVSIAVVSPHLDRILQYVVSNPKQREWNPEWGEAAEYGGIAIWKAKTALEKGVPTSVLANDFPLSLQRGQLFRYPGGVPGPRNEFAVGTSGIMGRGDEAISKIIITLMEALAHLEVDKAVIEKKKYL